MRKRHFILLGLMFLAGLSGLAWGLTEEYHAVTFEGSIG